MSPARHFVLLPVIAFAMAGCSSIRECDSSELLAHSATYHGEELAFYVTIRNSPRVITDTEVTSNNGVAHVAVETRTIEESNKTKLRQTELILVDTHGIDQVTLGNDHLTVWTRKNTGREPRFHSIQPNPSGIFPR